MIINAGWIVAYYPSKFRLHHRAEALNGRDPYGELVEAAHKDGLMVARMVYQAHQDCLTMSRKADSVARSGRAKRCLSS